MSNCILAFPNIADTTKATLSGGSWVSTLPLTSMQDEVLGTLARSTNANIANTLFDITFDKARLVKVFGLIAHNISTSGQYRLRAFPDAASRTALTGAIYDSGLTDVWIAIYDSLVLEWEDDSLWDGKPSAESLASLNPSLIFVLASNTLAQYWRFEIQDATNPAGYIEAGKLVMAAQWQPTYNMQYGASLGTKDRSEVEESIGGTTYASRRSIKRVAKFKIAALSEAEAMAKAFDIKRIAGNTSELLFVWDPADAAQLQRMSFLGRITDSDPVAIPTPDWWETTFEIEERV